MLTVTEKNNKNKKVNGGEQEESEYLPLLQPKICRKYFLWGKK